MQRLNDRPAGPHERRRWGRRGVRGIVLATAAAGVLAVAGCGGSSSDDSSSDSAGASGENCTLTFAATVPLTGDSAVWGKAVTDAYAMAFDEINADGGVKDGPRKGCTLKLAKFDTQSDPAKATTLAQTIVSSGDKYFGSLGTIESAVLMAQMPIFERAEMPVGDPYVSADAVTESGFKQIMRMVVPQTENGRHAAHNAAESVDGKRFAVIKSEGDYSDATFKGFKEESEKIGLDLVQVSTFESGSTNFSAIVTKLSGQKLDGIMVIGYPADTGNLVRQIRAAGVKQPIVADGGSSSPTFIELARGASEGVFTSTIFDAESDDPKVKEFVTGFKKLYGHEPHESAAYAYDLAYVIAQALDEGVEKRENLAEKVRSLSYEGVTGVTKFGPNGQADREPPARVVVKDGKFVPVSSSDDAE